MPNCFIYGFCKKYGFCENIKIEEVLLTLERIEILQHETIVISRFARNIVTILKFVRELKKLGIGIF